MTETLPSPAGRLLDEPIVPIRIAVLTVSDTRDADSDTSGAVLAERIASAGHAIAARAWVADDVAAIRDQVSAWVTARAADVILTTGGTGLMPRDVTPEALTPLFDKVIDGFSVLFHMASFQTVGLSTMQSRATAGLIDGVPVFCLPGSNGAVRDGWDKVIRWQIDSRHRPCNLTELMPHLRPARTS